MRRQPTKVRAKAAHTPPLADGGGLVKGPHSTGSGQGCGGRASVQVPPCCQGTRLQEVGSPGFTRKECHSKGHS